MKRSDNGYSIAGKDCGRDENGVFHCVCGKCIPLDESMKELTGGIDFYPYCEWNESREPYDPYKKYRNKWWFKYVYNEDPHSIITTALVSFITTVVVLILRSC